MKEFLDKINFPYSSVRKGQDKFLKDVYETIEQKKNILVSAPTGLGKTISGIAPALYHAKKNNLTVVCLTSRQTQANQIVKTIKDINSKSKLKINYTAFIGKRSMCYHEEKDLYPPTDFNDFCRKVRETGKCKYFKNAKNTEFEEQINAIIQESSDSFMSVEGFVELAGSNNFCPYELAGNKSFQADLVICDFNYVFSEGIRENFLGKIGRQIEECILLVDEAHNLPDRIRNSYSYSLNTDTLKNALKELQDFIKTHKYDHYIDNLRQTLEEIYFDKMGGKKEEYKLTRKDFYDLYLSKFSSGTDIVKIIDDLNEVAALVKEERVVSFVKRVADFIDMWDRLNEEFYLRSIEKDTKKDSSTLGLRIRCIDPAEISSKIINNTYSSILMSGTLSPIEMFRDVLGVGNANLLEIESPFSKERLATYLIDDVTSKYSARTPAMYKKIADHIESLLHSAGESNAIIFFPGYDFMDKVLANINIISLQRKILKEQRYMTKDQKEKFVDEFKNNGFASRPKVLFAITSGSFSEGLDLPDKALEMVAIVGLPLGVPDLYTENLINYFDRKFKKGQLYGYVYPAITKIVQAAGRCIRTETDKGVVAFLDNRFIWPVYAQCFPKDWKLKRNKDYKIEISNFFNE